MDSRQMEATGKCPPMNSVTNTRTKSNKRGTMKTARNVLCGVIVGISLVVTSIHTDFTTIVMTLTTIALAAINLMIETYPIE